jgi:hypothetical protein
VELIRLTGEDRDPLAAAIAARLLASA